MEPFIHVLRYINLHDLPGSQYLLEHDIKLTIGEGMSLYTPQESLEEISRHHEAGAEYDDFSQMIDMIKSLPEHVLVCWGGG